jgi:hypothetical protein
MQGNALVYVALYGWIPLVLLLFAVFPARRAVILAFLIAWLFLPMSHEKFDGIPDYNKMSAACFGVLISSFIFDSRTLFSFKPRIWDLPMLIWCIVPFFSSMTNGLGPYDGIVAVSYQTTDWGLPYFIGRVYFNDLRGLRELAMGVLVGGMIYAPLCWYEIRFSPQLHMMFYGFHQFDFDQSRRDSGFRPTVFMQHGLAVGLWMAATTITAFWLWRSKVIRTEWGIPIGLIFFILMITTYFCHSTGATVLMFLGLALLYLTEKTKWPVWMLMLALAAPTYMFARGTGIWTGEDLLHDISRTDPSRADSLRVRFFSEGPFVQRAMEQPVFGWAGWDRFRLRDAQGNGIGVPDALWIIALGHNGLVGLISLTLALILPIFLLWKQIPIPYWIHPGAAPAAALAVLCGLYMCDNLFNAMINPIFVLGAGGICGLTFSLREPATVLAHRAPPPSKPAPITPGPVPARPGT